LRCRHQATRGGQTGSDEGVGRGRPLQVGNGGVEGAPGLLRPSGRGQRS
jgi:hypothetical protein